jgi:hypothetical protein
VLELDVSPASALPIYRQNQSDHLVGGSLDGYVYGFKGIIELKVPRSATPIGYIKNGGLLATPLHPTAWLSMGSTFQILTRWRHEQA